MIQTEKFVSVCSRRCFFSRALTFTEHIKFCETDCLSEMPNVIKPNISFRSYPIPYPTRVATEQ